MARNSDSAIARFVGLIEQYGFAFTPVGYGTCDVVGCTHPPSPFPWTYTVGLWESGLPELVVMGTTADIAGRAVHAMVRRLQVGRIETDDVVVSGELRLRLGEVPAAWAACDPSRMSRWFAVYGGSIAPVVRQVLVADPEGRFPDEAEPSPFHATQPVLQADPFAFPVPYDGPSPRSQRRRRAA